MSQKASATLVLLLCCSQLAKLVQSQNDADVNYYLAEDVSELQGAEGLQRRQLDSFTTASAQKGPKKSAQLRITTSGMQCRRKVFNSLALAIKNAILARTASGKRRLISVTPKTCRTGRGRALLATDDTVTYTFNTTTGGDTASLLTNPSTQQAISSASEVQIMSFDVTASSGDISPAPSTTTDTQTVTPNSSSSSSSSSSTCGDTTGAGNQTYLACSTVLAYWYQYDPAAAAVNITGLSALDAAKACCKTDHPYGSPGATCSNLFAVADSAPTMSYSNSSCALQLGKGWQVDAAAFDTQVDTAETENEVAKLCCMNGNPYPESATCGDVIGDGSDSPYATGLCNEQLAVWWYYDASKAAVAISQVDSELEAAWLCCKTESIYPFNATCGDLTAAQGAASQSPFPDNLCRQLLADDYYYDNAQARIRVDSFNSVKDAAVACCKTDIPRSLSGTCGDLDGDPDTPDTFTTAMCQAALGGSTDWKYETANKDIEVGQAATAEAVAILCCVNEDQALFDTNITCGNIDSDPSNSGALNLCAKYAADVVSPGGQLGGVVVYDPSKVNVALHSVTTGVEAAAMCCKEVYPQGATCGDMWPAFPDATPFDGCDKQLKTDRVSLAASIAGKSHQEAADICCMYKHRKLVWVV